MGEIKTSLWWWHECGVLNIWEFCTENCCLLTRWIQKTSEHRVETHGRLYTNLHFALICHKGEPLAARDERNRSDSWEMSLCTGCTTCHVAQRMCPETAWVSYCELIFHPGIHLYPKSHVNRIWSDLRVYWKQEELGCGNLAPFSSPQCVCLTSNLVSTHSPQMPSTDGKGNPKLLSLFTWESSCHNSGASFWCNKVIFYWNPLHFPFVLTPLLFLGKGWALLFASTFTSCCCLETFFILWTMTTSKCQLAEHLARIRWDIANKPSVNDFSFWMHFLFCVSGKEQNKTFSVPFYILPCSPLISLLPYKLLIISTNRSRYIKCVALP